MFGKPFTYGITLNNNPGVEDLWNSTPAWGFPVPREQRSSRTFRSGAYQWKSGPGCGGSGWIHDVERALLPSRNDLPVRTHRRHAAQRRHRICPQYPGDRTLLAYGMANIQQEQLFGGRRLRHAREEHSERHHRPDGRLHRLGRRLSV